MQGLKAPNRVTSAEQAYSSLLAAILDGSIPPGASLPLQELSQSLGMSMMPIREALRQLENSGIIETIPHRGARVRPVSSSDLEDTYLARIEMEGTLVELAATRFKQTDAEAARSALDAQQVAIDSGDMLAARQCHEDFHFTVYRASGSDWLLRCISPVWHNSERYRSVGMVDPKKVDSRREEHEAILAACVEQDGSRAREALRNHLLSTVRKLDPEAAQRLQTRLSGIHR